MSVFPITIPDKVNDPELLAFMQAFGPSRYLKAEELNLYRDALNELNSRLLTSGIEGVSNRLLGDWTFTLDGNVGSIAAGRAWIYSSVIYMNEDPLEHTFSYTTPGKERYDIIVAKNDSTLAVVAGSEVTEGTPVTLPTVPEGALFVTFVRVSSLNLEPQPSPGDNPTLQIVVTNGGSYTASGNGSTIQWDVFKLFEGVGRAEVLEITTPTGETEVYTAGRMVGYGIGARMYTRMYNDATGEVISRFVGADFGNEVIAMIERSSDIDANGAHSLELEKPDYGQLGITKIPKHSGNETVAFLSNLAGILGDAETYADGLFATLVGASPADLDTLQEISAALQDNPDIIAQLLTSLGNRLRFDVNNQGLSSLEKANALTNLGIVVADLLNRANHTGTQSISTISGLQDAIDAKSNRFVRNHKQIVMPAFGSATLMTISGQMYSVTGATSRSFSDTNDYMRTPRLGVLTSAAAGNVSLMRQTTLYFNLTSGYEGLSMFGMAEAAASASGIRAFWGFGNGIGTQTNVEPDTLTNIFGCCKLSTSNNLHLIHNDASGTATVIDLGANFPVNTESADRYLRYVKVLSPTSIYIKIWRFGTSFASPGHTITTDLPASSLGLCMRNWISNNAGAVIVGFDFMGDDFDYSHLTI